MKDITVIIPIHTNENKELELLQTAIKSVEDQQTQPEVLSIVCPKTLEKDIKKLDFGKLNKQIIINTGETDFASQINLGVEKTSTEFFCLLELDDELSNIWLKNAKRTCMGVKFLRGDRSS